MDFSELPGGSAVTDRSQRLLFKFQHLGLSILILIPILIQILLLMLILIPMLILILTRILKLILSIAIMTLRAWWGL